MAPVQPLRLLHQIKGEFSVLDTYSAPVAHFDIISHTWGEPVRPYNCGIKGVDWDVQIAPEKLDEIKRLMIHDHIQYLWVDCVCIKQTDDKEKAVEISRMYEYYRNARKCYILMDMPKVWKPQDIVDNLKFLDHVLFHMRGAALTSEALGLTENLTKRLSKWADDEPWTFDVDKVTVRSAAIDLGILNCYSTCISQVISLFRHSYFYRVWTFQEMLLGKNITLWGIDSKNISCIGELHIWMDLATDAKDKAYKLRAWIEACRVLNTESVSAVLRIIEEDKLLLDNLQTQVKGISSARADIISGGESWWYENHKGISNVFSAISIRPRKCREKGDIFRGLLGVFSGLFTAEEIQREMSGDDIEKISFAFFRQLSTKTKYAWTKLAISSGERGEWDWIPVVENYGGELTTDCFAGVVNLGRLEEKGRVKALAMTGIQGAPQKYMRIVLRQDSGESRGFPFIFKGCNCGKNLKTGTFSSEQIPTNDQPRNVVRDETGRILVQCATILGSILDPGGDHIKFRRKLLRNLQPNWDISDPNAKPTEWIDRLVSGSFWEKAEPQLLRTHNRSVNYRMISIDSCRSRLQNETTASLLCDVHVNCGCTITAPFSLIFEAITAVDGSFLGEAAAFLDKDDRIILQDGLGLVQVGDVGRTFNLVAFGGNINAYKSYASSCRSTKKDKPVTPKLPWPSGRALVKEEFTHDFTDTMRDYGYVETGGCGNLLICRNHVISQYKIIGVCIDESIPNKKGEHTVTIR
ncbi:heterokaryon incompatibility protein-domain-containing protein [Xylogone sp. PMI_703]|nr:heterokaryon incompatibility protein-domain-containing protein [Xylogone sp. PMI_703]